MFPGQSIQAREDGVHGLPRLVIAGNASGAAKFLDLPLHVRVGVARDAELAEAEVIPAVLVDIGRSARQEIVAGRTLRPDIRACLEVVDLDVKVCAASGE